MLTGSRRQLLQGHRMGVTSMAYHEERRLLFSSGFDHDALVWSPFTPTVLYKLPTQSQMYGIQWDNSCFERIQLENANSASSISS